MTAEGEAGDDLRVPVRATALLCAVTLAYLLLEAAFNARLIDVLGATEGEVGSPQAIAGLELWGRLISSFAVALALGTAHVSQMYRQRAPFPVGLLDRRTAPWGRLRFALSGLIIAAAAAATFLVERAIVDDGAERQDPVTLWWSHYGARASDFGGLALSHAGSTRQLMSQSEEALAKYYKEEKISARPLTFADLDTADTKAFIAILPFSLQNYAQHKPRSEGDQRPYTALEIQSLVNKGFLETITNLSAQQSRGAILVPVRRCFEMLYDQSPPYETIEPGFPLPVSRCLSRNAVVSTFVGDLPSNLNTAAQQCFSAPAQNGARYADYVSLNCVFFAAQDQARQQASLASDIYLRLYEAAKAQALREISADPRKLPETARRQLATDLRAIIEPGSGSLTAQQRDRLFNTNTDTPPPCGGLVARFVDPFARHYSRFDSAAWLRAREDTYCALFDRFLPDNPEPAARTVLYQLNQEFPDTVNREIRNAGLQAVTFEGGLPTYGDFYAEVERQLVAPVREVLDGVLQSQFAASAADSGQLPRVGQYKTLDEFFGNPVISLLARDTLQELSDSAFQCVGIQRVAQSVRFRGSLQSISTDWDRQFHARVVDQLQQNGVATRFSGLLTDFSPGQRCHAAGVSAYHRATMPGTALVISMAGLLFHACKLIFYLAALLHLGLAPRLWLVAGGLGVMAAGPQRIESLVLQQPPANLLIDAFETSHGSYFASGTRWLIRAELLLYPFGKTLSNDILLPLGVDFSREVSDPVADARSKQISKICSSVPQVSQTSEYETLRAFMTNRTFCDSR